MEEYIRYMRAWLRLNTDTDLSMWSDEEIVDSFALLPLPARTFPQWKALVSGEAEKEEIQPKGDTLERLKTEGSHLFKQGIVRLGE